MDPESIVRLKEEQLRALQITDADITRWETFRDDYVALKGRLTTLPHRTSHSIMVPFGPLAFMPGKLVHTNELLVLLGDNWFVEQSAVQSCDIIDRRLTEVNGQISKLQSQRALLLSRLDFTSQLQGTVLGEDGFEIREDFDAVKEAKWKGEREKKLKQRTSNVTQRTDVTPADVSTSNTMNQSGTAHLTSDPSSSSAPGVSESESVGGCLTDDDVWRRLEQLEMEENKGSSEVINAPAGGKTSTSPSTSVTPVTPTIKRKVSFSSTFNTRIIPPVQSNSRIISPDQSDDQLDSDDLEELSCSSAEHEEINSNSSVNLESTVNPGPSVNQALTNPTPLKSILKPASTQVGAGEISAEHSTLTSEELLPRAAVPFSKKAFGEVTERPAASVQTSAATNPHSSSTGRVSKFKARQQKLKSG